MFDFCSNLQNLSNNFYQPWHYSTFFKGQKGPKNLKIFLKKWSTYLISKLDFNAFLALFSIWWTIKGLSIYCWTRARDQIASANAFSREPVNPILEFCEDLSCNLAENIFYRPKSATCFSKPLPFFQCKKSYIKCKMSDLLFYQAPEKLLNGLLKWENRCNFQDSKIISGEEFCTLADVSTVSRHMYFEEEGSIWHHYSKKPLSRWLSLQVSKRLITKNCNIKDSFFITRNNVRKN
mgnify:FL=1